MSVLLILCITSLCFLVEDKVKDQLEAAHPEPIIEEVVRTPLSLNLICFAELMA